MKRLVVGVSDGAGALAGVASGVTVVGAGVGAALGAFRCNRFMRNLVGSVMVLINRWVTKVRSKTYTSTMQ